MKNCERCKKKIPKERLRVLPDTRLCVKCSQEVGGDYEVRIIEENVNGGMESEPIIIKNLREIKEK